MKNRYRFTVALCVAALLGYFTWLGYFASAPFVTIIPQHPRTDVAAVVMSGDMGFKVGMGRQIARRLSDDGIPVIGVNSLTYFRTRRTAAEAAALVQESMRRAEALTHARRIILIGQSFGADMLHVGLAGLPPASRERVAMVALVVPGATVEYRASPGEMFTFLMHEDDALPTGRALTWAPLLCIFGEQESASLCPLLWQRNVHTVALPGGHPLHYDADAVYREVRREMVRARLSPA
ncbi:MAG: AcvB/VirJ family lysyl-phosphatidylglycerol hydrolase [Sphingobium phenoxybenzoativorans]